MRKVVKMREKIVLLSVRMTLTERNKLDKLARATGRNRSNVVKRLLSLLDMPEVKNALIEPQPHPVNEEDPDPELDINDFASGNQ